MLVKGQAWHHWKGIPRVRHVTLITEITPLQRVVGDQNVTQMTDITPLQRIAGDQIYYSNDRCDTITKECRVSDLLLMGQT